MKAAAGVRVNCEHWKLPQERTATGTEYQLPALIHILKYSFFHPSIGTTITGFGG